VGSDRIVVTHAGSLVRPPDPVPFLRAIDRGEPYLFEAANPRHEHEWRLWEGGFAQGPYIQRVHPSIMWATLAALAEGAALATEREFA
jgi:hypothetical protein